MFSKKWRWLNLWMVSSLRVLSEELKDFFLRRSENCFSTEQNHPEHPTRFKKMFSLEEMKAQKEDRFLPRKTDSLT